MHLLFTRFLRVKVFLQQGLRSKRTKVEKDVSGGSGREGSWRRKKSAQCIQTPLRDTRRVRPAASAIISFTLLQLDSEQL